MKFINYYHKYIYNQYYMLNGIQGIFWALKVRPVWGPLYSLDFRTYVGAFSPRFLHDKSSYVKDCFKHLTL